MLMSFRKTIGRNLRKILQKCQKYLFRQYFKKYSTEILKNFLKKF